MPSNQPRVKREEKYEYKDKSTDKLRQFKAVGDEIVVTFDRSAPMDGLSAARALDNSAIYVAAPEAGFAVLRTVDMRAARDSLAAARPVANELPVMVDDEGLRRYFLPDEFTVQFADGVSAKEAEKILERHGAAVRKKQRTPGYYTVGVPDGAGLFETIGALAKHKEVAFAEPSEFGIDDALALELKRGLAEAQAPFEEPAADDLRYLAETEEVPEPVEVESDVQALPTDTYFGRLWGLHNTGQSVNGTSGSIDADIDVPQAWTTDPAS